MYTITPLHKKMDKKIQQFLLTLIYGKQCYKQFRVLENVA